MPFLHEAHSSPASADLARSITRRASRHTFFTIRLLVDRERVVDAFRAYAYFRWVDDQIDLVLTSPAERGRFLSRQSALILSAYRGEEPQPVTPAERMVLDLIRGDSRRESGLACYIRNMMDVMAFDAGRRGRTITQSELDAYVRSLAVAVTEALHYFIGHGLPAPHSPARYLAVTAAHITHMLRDTREDVAAGYFNIPVEVLSAESLDPGDLARPAYRAWVRQRVLLARRGFELGKGYLAQVSNRRFRLAGFAYCARFEGVLDAIERNQHDLTADVRPLPVLTSAWGWSRALVAALPSPRQGRSADGAAPDPDARVNPSSRGAHPSR